jgi:hypothetical protein
MGVALGIDMRHPSNYRQYHHGHLEDVGLKRTVLRELSLLQVIRHTPPVASLSQLLSRVIMVID